MQTLVTASLRAPDEGAFAAWLVAHGYEPLDVLQRRLLSDADVHALVAGAPVPDVAQPEPATGLPASRVIPLDPALLGALGGDRLDAVFPRSRALRILESIPSSPERVQAILTRRYLVHYARPSSGADVWGLVCLEGQRVRVRFRHGSAADLEDATRHFLQACKAETGEGGLFGAVHDEVPVKEDGAIEPAYTGRYLSDEAKRERARRDKKLELLMTKVAFVVVSLCVLTSVLPVPASASEPLRWLLSWIDRIGTGALVTMVQSYLSYRLHAAELLSKPVMDWR